MLDSKPETPDRLGVNDLTQSRTLNVGLMTSFEFWWVYILHSST